MKLTKSRLKRLIREELDNMASEEASSALDVFKELLAAKAKYNTIRSRGTKISLSDAFERSRLKAKIVDLDSKFKDSMKRASEAEINSIVAYIRSLPKEEKEDAIMTAMGRADDEALTKALNSIWYQHLTN